MWKTIADHFGIEAPAYDGRQQSLQELMADAGPIWRGMAEKYGLVEPDIIRLATWWHTDVDVTDWLLFIQDSPAAQGGRGLGTARVYNRAGVLVASIAQEGMVRQRPPRPGDAPRPAGP